MPAKHWDDMGREVRDGVLAPWQHAGRLPTPGPATLIFVVAQRCNSHCNMCYIWENKNPPEISVEEARRIFARDREDFRTLRKLSLTGGEPSLRRDLADLVGAVLDSTPAVRTLRLASHGMVPDRTLAAVEGCWSVAHAHGVERFEVQISLDGVGEVHERIRGIRGGYARVRETLERLMQLQKVVAALRISLSTVVQPLNLENLPELRRLAATLGLPITFSPIVMSGAYYANQSRDLDLSVGGDARAQAFFEDLAHTSRGTDAFYYADMRGMLEGKPRGRICMQGYHSCVLEADGGLHACVNSETLTFGNLREQPFREIWWGEKAEALRRQLHQEICPTCPSKCYARPVSAGEVLRISMQKLSGGSGAPSSSGSSEV